MTSTLIENLIAFNLTRQEAAIYVEFLNHGEMSGYEVAKETGISRSNVYSALQSLAEKGALYLIEGESTRYTPVAVGDFLKKTASGGPGKVQPTYKPGVVWCDLHQVLPEKITRALAEALPLLEGNLKGYADPDSVLTAPETRSSSPVRIVRDESKQSTGLLGLYPAGEGAGYAGGIMSAAIDGMLCAEALLESL